MQEVKTLDAPSGRVEDAAKERPILFSAPMVRALLEGRKTQTRRIVDWERLHKQASLPFPTRVRLAWFKMLNGWGLDAGDDCMREVKCPYGQPGDRLYVREAWSPEFIWTGLPPREMIPGPVWYWADGRIPTHGDWTKPKPGIHMPRWASRITLEVTGVRVERLQDITPDDILAEGVTDPEMTIIAGVGVHHPDRLRTEWQKLWTAINGADSWDANPWVWAVEFKRTDARSAPEVSEGSQS